MKALTSHALMAEYSSITHKPCMWVSFSDRQSYGKDPDLDELFQAAPWLDFDLHAQLIMDGGGCLVFDSVEEMDAVFAQTVGDDGQTKANPYNGPARCYCLTCIDGELSGENT